MKTLEQLRAEFAEAQAKATVAALAYHNAATADPNGDPLAKHDGLGAGIRDYQPGGPLLAPAEVTKLVDKGMASIKTADWLEIAKKVIGSVAKIVV